PLMRHRFGSDQTVRIFLEAKTATATMAAMMRSFFMSPILPVRPRAHRSGGPLDPIDGSDRQQVSGAGVGGGVAQLRHGPRLDLTDALAGEVEVLPHLLERARFPAVEAETQF